MVVWVASYPRSGNTFLRVILFQVFGLNTYSVYDEFAAEGDASIAATVGHAALPMDWTPEQARQDENLWMVKTHNPPTDEGKAIYIIRDGRESSLSYRKYIETFNDQQSDLSTVIKGQIGFGSWSDHVKAWNPEGRRDTLLLRFEDLVADPVGFLPAIGNFLGCRPVQDKIPTFEELRALNPSFFRSGRTNSWTEAFSEEDHLLFWLLQGETMLQYGYCDHIPEVFRGATAASLAGLSAAARGWLARETREPASVQPTTDEEALARAFQDAVEKQSCVQRQSEEIARCHQRMAELLAQRADLKESLSAMRRSKSWKITKPLRSFERFLSGEPKGE